MRDVAADLKSGKILPDQMPINYFINPKSGEVIAESNRTLAAFAMANVRPTVFNQIEVTSKLLKRIVERPIRYQGEVFEIPGKSIPVTMGQNNDTITDIVRILW